MSPSNLRASTPQVLAPAAEGTTMGKHMLDAALCYSMGVGSTGEGSDPSKSWVLSRHGWCVECLPYLRVLSKSSSDTWGEMPGC